MIEEMAKTLMKKLWGAGKDWRPAQSGQEWDACEYLQHHKQQIMGELKLFNWLLSTSMSRLAWALKLSFTNPRLAKMSQRDVFVGAIAR